MLNPNFRRHLKLLYSACLISTIVFLTGCSLVLSSTLLPELRAPTSKIQINDDEASWIASVQFLVSPIGSLTVGALTDKIGRRKTIQIAFIPIILGWLTLFYANSATTILIGRFLNGICTGLAPFTILYLAEVSPAEYRHLYTSLVNIFVGVGMVIQSGLSLLFEWHTVAAIWVAVSVASCGALFLLPEPAMWLRSKGRVREAEDSDKWFGLEPQVQVDAGVEDGQRDGGKAAAAPSSCWAVYTHPTVWKPTLIMMAFFVCQQGCGFYVLLLYSSDVLRDSGVSQDGAVVTMYLSTARVVGSLAFSLLFNVRRRTLTAVSSAGMAVSVSVFIAYLRWYSGVDDPPYSGIEVGALVFYVMFSVVGIMPLPWMLGGELFPMAVKGKMCAFVNIFGNEAMFLVGILYPTLSSTLGLINIWSIFAGFCVITALFGAFVMPETRGKTLDEIVKSFESKKNTSESNAA